MRYVTFGEIMLRLSPRGYKRFVQAEGFDAIYAGAEANAAVSLACFGCDVSFVTKLPENELGASAANMLSRYGVDISDIVTGDGRLGIYFYENGVGHRPGKVIYDRAGSTVARAERREFDWKKIFKNAGWYHYTGITPAVSESAAEITFDSVSEAKKLGLTVSCDLNYRSMLWSKTEAQSVMKRLSHYSDIIITNLDQAYDVLAVCPVEGAAPESDRAYISVSRQIAKEYGCRTVAYTSRKSFSASHNAISGLLYDAVSDRLFRSVEYDITQIVERIGGGDSFGAGLIYGISRGFGPQRAIDFAVAAECLKHTVEGDFNICTVEEIEKLLSSDGTVRVIR